MDIQGILVPIFVCVVLPVSIVWIIFSTARNSDNKRADVLIKAIENNANIDADKLAEALNKKPQTPRQLFISRLLRGCIFTFIGVALALWSLYGGLGREAGSLSFILSGLSFALGISYLIVSYVTRKSFKE